MGYNHIGNAGINGRTDMLSTQLDNNNKVRYVRFWSTKAATQYGMKIYEFQVFGREYTASGDTEVPVMVSASLVSKTGTSAVIAVEATDNDEVAKYRVVETNHGIDAKYVANEGQITITGLQGATTYAFEITAFIEQYPSSGYDGRLLFRASGSLCGSDMAGCTGKSYLQPDV